MHWTVRLQERSTQQLRDCLCSRPALSVQGRVRPTAALRLNHFDICNAAVAAFRLRAPKDNLLSHTCQPRVQGEVAASAPTKVARV